MTIHGEGKTIRNFVYVEDVAKAFETILYKGEISKTYNIGTDNEHSVLDISTLLHSKLGGDKSYSDCVEYVEDRPFNDFRYSVDSKELIELGCNTTINFSDGMEKTIDWYKRTNTDSYFVHK